MPNRKSVSRVQAQFACGDCVTADLIVANVRVSAFVCVGIATCSSLYGANADKQMNIRIVPLKWSFRIRRAIKTSNEHNHTLLMN